MHRNRVSPTGELVATSLRGAWTGNRGILHEGTEIRRFHAGKLWIVCALSYREQRLQQWARGHYTVLFFHDEAVALAAGHRPCAFCRRESYDSYRKALITAWYVPRLLRAEELDELLHSQRLLPRTHTRRLHPMPWLSLPDGVFVQQDGGPALVLGDALVPWTAAGYGTPEARPRLGSASVLTPPASVAAIRGGYAPQIAPVIMKDPNPHRGASLHDHGRLTPTRSCPAACW